MDNVPETRSIELSADVLESIEPRVDCTEFETTAEYVEFVLEELCYHLEAVHPSDDPPDVDETTVNERLQALGYRDE